MACSDQTIPTAQRKTDFNPFRSFADFNPFQQRERIEIRFT